jgi:hypothetical protein
VGVLGTGAIGAEAARIFQVGDSSTQCILEAHSHRCSFLCAVVRGTPHQDLPLACPAPLGDWAIIGPDVG